MNPAPKIKTKTFPYKFWVVGSLGLFVLAFIHFVHAEEPKRILKWKDDKGVTQYGDKIPTQYSNRENAVINQQGITVKRNKPFVYQDHAAEQAKIEQDKKDRALLSAFTHESEIDLARDRHLQLDQVTLDGLQMQKTNQQKRLMDTQKYANGFIKRKKTVPADISADLKSSNAEIAKIDEQISQRKSMMEATRKRFDDDKKRYVELKYHGEADNTLPATSALPAPPATKP